MSSSELFLNFLTQRGVLTSKRREDVATIIEKQPGSNIVELLVRGGFVKSEDLARYEAEFFNLDFARLSNKIPDAVLSTLPFYLARDCGAICFSASEQFLKFALLYPDTDNMAKLRSWAREKQVEIEYSICSLVDYEVHLGAYLAESEPGPASSFKKEDNSIPDGNWREMPVDKIVGIVLREAIDRQASEIIISKTKEHVLIRFRMKDNLIPVANLPQDIYESLINYLKGLAHLPLSIKNNFVQGEIQMMVRELPRIFELKVLDSVNGEVLSLKLKQADEEKLQFEQLGFSRHLQELTNQALERPGGKIVVVGLNGSGKTTTLHSLIQKLSGVNNNIVTVERNIENNLSGVTRVQVKPEIGQTYENILAEIQRWQPDYLVVDEITSPAVGSHLLHSVLAGTPVLTSVSGTNIREGLQAILNLDLEVYQLAAILNLVLAQKLVRRVCPHCSESLVVPTNVHKKVLNILATVPMQHWPRGLDFNSSELYAPKSSGCSWCDHSGYNGRLALHEGLLFDDRLRAEFAQINKINELDSLVEKYLTINMLQDGLMKALKGLTTLDEVFSNCEEYNII